MLQRRMVFCSAMLLGIVAVILSASVPHTAHRAMAQPEVGATELAYDDGIPYNIVYESMIACRYCMRYQGVVFDLGGLDIAAVTSVRFYAGGKSTLLRVHIVDQASGEALLEDPIQVSVSAAKWYTVSIPEITVTGSFAVWVETQSTAVMPYHDYKNDAGKSLMSEDYRLGAQQVETGDLLIRASVTAVIEVGKEAQYKYHTIQEAVNDAGPLLTILVHPGTYVENVRVNKDLTVKSSGGPSVTFVQPADSNADVFDVTADGVAIQGFAIQGSAGGQVAGVRLNDVSDCLIADNIITDNYYGICVSEPQTSTSSRNVLVQNVASSNVYGIWIGGLENNICGNRLAGNTAAEGAAVYLSTKSADNLLRFNSFSSDPGPDLANQVYYAGTFKAVDAVQNWWGDASGPYHESKNADATGVGVGNMVSFSPWLGAEPLAVKTGTPDVSFYELDARSEASTTVTLSGSGDPTIWVARYAGNPAGDFPETSIGRWIDVCFGDTGGVDEVEIRVDYSPDEIGDLKEGALRLYWWNGSEWVVCTKQKLYKSDDYIRATITADTGPSLGNLAGTPFAIGETTSGGSFQWWWIAVVPLAIVGLFVVVIIGRILLRLFSSRGSHYDYE